MAEAIGPDPARVPLADGTLAIRFHEPVLGSVELSYEQWRSGGHRYKLSSELRRSMPHGPSHALENTRLFGV
jgi:hypothetical protein